MSINFTAVHDRIKAILAASTTPAFTVVVGNPLQLPPDGYPYAAFWYEGREDPPEGPGTFGQRMNTYRYSVRCFWLRRPELSAQESYQDDIAEADRSLRAAFWADYTLDGNVTRIDVSDSEIYPDGFFPLEAVGQPGNVRPLRFFYSLEFELTVTDLEGEAISA